MPTWKTWPRDRKNTRSPGRRWDGAMRVVARYWAREVRGRVLPTRANDHLVRPEQSKRRGPMAPHRYAAPLRVAATLTTFWPLAAENAAWAAGADASWAKPPTETAMARTSRMRTNAVRRELWTEVMRVAPGLRLRSGTCRGRGPVPPVLAALSRFGWTCSGGLPPKDTPMVCPNCWALRSCHQRVVFDVPGAVAGLGETPGAPPVGRGFPYPSAVPDGT